uniref:Uncharacterized protein n=1 Tax=Myripristis murdjan TaxID=586833 RepID=A0A667YBX2_9TELE
GSLPIAHIAIGAVYRNECPAAPFIPLYLIVSGAGSLLLTAHLAFPKFIGWNEDGLGFKSWLYYNISLSLFLFIWFIFGNYHVYSIYPPNYNKDTADPIGVRPHCNRTVYLFAFWTITLIYGFAAFSLLIVGCTFSCLAALKLLTVLPFQEMTE